ncbi:WAP four-disulfide core domain protein 2-like [Pectinophora gossypiella]|uniref:WAP four-disulfide core domain protein 2-like n=1 Tax=Pectinophora gossypiella TaxID=13191 RepID=UPI00214EA623|nr:WAP four-disulfide core domain protein 2-like [Pectinophora gossypiella]
MLRASLTVLALIGLFGISASLQGSCPPTLTVDLCDPACGPSKPCNETQLCCPTACGGSMCVDPVSERHVVTLVKAGHCPENPQGVWVCAHSCTGDSDCPRTLKCCHNRCGALRCMKPEYHEDNTVPPGQ